jgi:inosose dehydratase
MVAPGAPDPDELLAAIAAAGYAGVDLGPVGYLGSGAELRGRLARHGLALCGGWVELRLTDPDGLASDLAGLESALDQFEAGAARAGLPPPRPTLADAGSPARAARPGRVGDARGLRLDRRGWRRLADGVARAAERCRERGFEPTFHHHVGTYVETVDEIEDLLDRTDVGLCLDTGHLLLGGGDPVLALADWGARINHVHLKDVRLTVLREVLAGGDGMHALWARGAFCELGHGDLDLDGFLEALVAGEPPGWLVVEQDRLLAPGAALAEAAGAQARNRAVLAAWERAHGG